MAQLSLLLANWHHWQQPLPWVQELCCQEVEVQQALSQTPHLPSGMR